MKKLISLLMILLLALTGVLALAEESESTPEVPTVTEPVVEEPVVEEPVVEEPVVEEPVVEEPVVEEPVVEEPVVEEPVVEEPVTTTEPGSNNESEAEEPSLIAKGLTVTVFGLAGVFLVLILFFLTIKLMHKMLK